MTLPGWTRSLRGRVLGVVSVGLFCQLAALAFDVDQLRRIGRSVSTVNATWLPLARLSARMEGVVDRGDRERMASLVSEADRALARGEGLPVEADEGAHLRAARSQVDDVRTALASTGDGDEALRAEILQLGSLAEARVAALSARTAAAQAQAVRLSLALVAASVPLGVLLLWYAGNALLPVRRLTEQVRRLEAGERPGSVAAGGADEIAALAHAFDAMVKAVDDRDRNLQALSLQLRRVLDSLVVAVIVVEDGVVRVTNPAAGQLWGLAEGDALPATLCALGEGRHERHDAERIQEVVVAPFRESGRILVGEDVTESRRDRERLVRSERLALVGQLLAQVTHEVRNPLNAMSLHAELLAEDVGGEGQAILATIVAEIRRLEAVTERYLDLARRRAPVMAPEDPAALVRGVVALEDERLRRLGVEVHVEAAETRVVDVDGNVVRRAILNLVRNAAEAGAPNVRVSVAVRPSAGTDVLELDVRDDGPGMEPAIAARIFEPFFTTKARGTGLGMALTRQGIEDLGGTISLESAPGAGTTVRVRIPVPPCSALSPPM